MFDHKRKKKENLSTHEDVRELLVVEEKRNEVELVHTIITKMWKGKIKVYVCSTCGTSKNDEGDCITHVVSHYPPEQQVEALELLMKENKDGSDSIDSSDN